MQPDLRALASAMGLSLSQALGLGRQDSLSDSLKGRSPASSSPGAVAQPLRHHVRQRSMMMIVQGWWCCSCWLSYAACFNYGYTPSCPEAIFAGSPAALNFKALSSALKLGTAERLGLHVKCTLSTALCHALAAA